MKIPTLIALLSLTVVGQAAEINISLAGQWRFQIDRADAGIGERWFERTLPDKINLPGGLTEQGIGDPVTVDTKWIGGIVDKSWFTSPEYAKYRAPGNVKVPFWLQPELYYAGAAWFQRDLDIPSDWSDRRVVLLLERSHWETRVWVDGKPFGKNLALATPHEYDLGQLPPGKHTLTIRVDNRLVVDVGDNSHCVSDHTQGNWNGLVGRIELRSTPLVWIEELQVFPHVATKSATVRGRIRNIPGQQGVGVVELSVEEVGATVTSASSNSRRLAAPKPFVVTWDATGGAFEAELPLGEAARLWDEFSPALYQVTAKLYCNNHRTSVLFGLREVSTDGTQITINGRKTFIRGTLDCCIFPKTGHPPTEVAEWRRIIRVAKSCGLNLIRFHSWCPPEAAFQAADELGFYFQVETCWPNQSTSLGDGKPVDQWSYAETDRILKAYGNHPSFIFMLHGNEPGGRNANAWLAKYVQHFKTQDPRRLWSSGAGWPRLPENQFHVTPDPRIQAWGGGLKTRINAQPPETLTDYREYIAARPVPVISHEIGQWCVYPNFEEIKKYTGYLKPKNFEIFRDTLNAHHLGDLAHQFLIASGKLQTLCYKEEIESALRTPGMGGFQLLDLHDFPGQGTALVGVLDPFWEEKGYVTAAEFSQFCNSTVPLARLAKRVFTTDEKLEVEIEVAHFGAAPLADAVVEWKLVVAGGAPVAQGEFPAKTIPGGNANVVGTVSAAFKNLPAPVQCKLVVKLRGTSFENDWDLWVYPAQPSESSSSAVLMTSQFDAAAQARLREGGNVLLTIPAQQVRNFDTAPVKLGFSSIFWNTAWTGRQAPTTLGILCDPKHPALAVFPTDFHSNWQWWYLIHRAGALRLELLPPDTQPVVRIIDDWFTARPLGLIVEGKVGPGKIVICGFDLTHEADDPVSRQMAASLARYLGSADCRPASEFTPEQIQGLFVERKSASLPGLRSVKADSDQSGYDAANALDGDPNTIWHTAWSDDAPNFPHELVVEFDAPREITGITALPRQDDNRNGWIKGYGIYASSDGLCWGEPCAKGEFAADASPKAVKFDPPVTARFLKLRASSGHANGPWASLAEFNVLRSKTQKDRIVERRH